MAEVTDSEDPLYTKLKYAVLQNPSPLWRAFFLGIGRFQYPDPVDQARADRLREELGIKWSEV